MRVVDFGCACRPVCEVALVNVGKLEDGRKEATDVHSLVMHPVRRADWKLLSTDSGGIRAVPRVDATTVE